MAPDVDTNLYIIHAAADLWAAHSVRTPADQHLWLSALWAQRGSAAVGTDEKPDIAVVGYLPHHALLVHCTLHVAEAFATVSRVWVGVFPRHAKLGDVTRHWLDLRGTDDWLPITCTNI